MTGKVEGSCILLPCFHCSPLLLTSNLLNKFGVSHPQACFYILPTCVYNSEQAEVRLPVFKFYINDATLHSSTVFFLNFCQSVRREMVTHCCFIFHFPDN